MGRFNSVICGAVCLVTSLWSATTSAKTPPLSVFAGPWQVRQVLVDERRTDRLLYQVDDPRLVGRSLAIHTRQVEADLPEAAGCDEPRLVPGHMALDTLLARTMQAELPAEGAARLFDAGLPGEQRVDLAWIQCRTGTFGAPLKNTAGTMPSGIWLALLPQGDALMPWYGRTLLVLQRPPLDAPITPSFACAKARGPAEKAICASPALAAYDQSLAKSWAYNLQFCDGNTRCIAAARRDQKQWLAQRKRCGADQICLQKVMRERLDALMTPAVD